MLITREELLGQNPYLGDGGPSVFGHPRYFWVERNSESSIPVLGAAELLKNLEVGRYMFVLETFAVPALGLERRQDALDLGFGVADQNRMNPDRESLRISVAQSLVQASASILIRTSSR